MPLPDKLGGTPDWIQAALCSASRCWRPLAAVLLLTVALARGVSAQDLAVNAPRSLDWAAARVQAINRASLSLALSRAGLSAPPLVTVTLVPESDRAARDWPHWVVGFAEPPDTIVIFPERATRYPYDSLESIVRHEITHLALARAAGGGLLPRWFHEGVAVSIEGGFGMTDEARLLLAMLARPAIGDVTNLFASGTESDSEEAYLLATALVADIRRRDGSDAIGRIAAAVSRGQPFASAFASVTGESIDTATEAAWGGYLRWTGWVLALSSLTTTWTVVLLLAIVAFVAQQRRRARRRQRWDEEDRAEAGPDDVGSSAR